MKDPRWELFMKTGLVEAYNFYKAKGGGYASDDQRSGDPERRLQRGR